MGTRGTREPAVLWLNGQILKGTCSQQPGHIGKCASAAALVMFNSDDPRLGGGGMENMPRIVAAWCKNLIHLCIKGYIYFHLAQLEQV